MLSDSARLGELVVVTGTGASMGLTDSKIPALSWKGLIRDGFAFGVKKGKITAAQSKSWAAQLDSTDMDELLGAAEFMGRKLEAPSGDLYARWLENVFKSVKPTNQKLKTAIRAIHDAGIPFCTLNYDPLLERITGLPAINMTETTKVTAWMRGRDSADGRGILHLHGSWDAPATCILGIRDYEAAVGNDVRDLIQRSLASFSRLLFVGCGDTFADPNFAALVKWLRGKIGTGAPQHYALVSDGEVSARHSDPAWHGFVEPLGYGASHSSLAGFLIEHLSALTTGRAKKTTRYGKSIAATSARVRVLQDYRAFLLKDCGQMTIEGVRADMDTAQRRFDLERLFVPLKVLPIPPEIPEQDPEREQKLLKWNQENKEPRPFGPVFAKQRRLALLALPGGGKTLLLKRLAVAYADPSRRAASEDALPDLDVTPVMIRCREWREHIHRPLLTLLQNMPAITGRLGLEGLSDALLPLFKTGKILLLVDGLDEIHDDALRSTFVDHLEAFLEEFKSTRLVVTSREVGFGLVAPSLARFCERWRLAPLDADAIKAFCAHWHRLMIGESPEAQAEARDVAQHLLQNDSLLRLAENPLLLTMLLVVKHGAGRLPPDRVTLYGRAVEVLLDTWNIKGHEPLNLKEAVPQLAFVAFQLTRARNQTATETELLGLLERAREEVPQIRRYAKDTPHEFLKRVELRSSLLVEAGRQAEHGRAVPFYQFRHLTFQEYLAAVAAVEGHYADYTKTDTVLTPLAPYLTADEWKEVIPMAAVLARKQAEPLVAALVAQSSELRRKVEAGEDFDGTFEWRQFFALPAPVARLVQCLVEETEAAPETLSTGLQLAAFFARGCRGGANWPALCAGPYGEELLHQAWLLYAPMQWPAAPWLVESCAVFAWLRHSSLFRDARERQADVQRLLGSDTDEEKARGLFICIGQLAADPEAAPIAWNIVEEYLFREDPAFWVPAAYAVGLNTWTFPTFSPPSPQVLARLLTLWGVVVGPNIHSYAPYALSMQLGRIPRHEWTPVLTEPQIEHVRRMTDLHDQAAPDYRAGLLVAFHAGNVWPEGELAMRLDKIPFDLRPATGEQDSIETMLEQMGEPGQRYRRSRRPGAKTR
jgi:hypothetical protein